MIALTADNHRNIAAKTHSSKHRAEVEASARCGCFFCFRQFAPSAIKAWTEGDQTALCPNCGVDAVIGSASPYLVNDKFLRRMHGQFFSYRTK
ncbi:MAG: cytoplasmic protein [Kofleriaceae bacterium]